MKQKHKTHTVRLLVVGLFFASIFFTMAADVALAQSSAASDTSSFSGLVPCGRNGDPSVDPAAAPCTTCHAVLGAKKAFDYLVSIMVVVGIAVIMGMGVLYILSGVNESLLKTAKGGIMSVFMGIVFVLSAWLIVSTVLRFVASDNFVNGGGTFGGVSVGDGVYGLTCTPNSQAGTAKLADGAIIAGAGSYANASSFVGSGTCSTITDPNNLCSVSKMQSSCFAANANIWSGICNVESAGGKRSIPSSTDICANLGSKSFSGGIFQINILANGSKLDSAKCSNLGTHDKCLKYNNGACVSWSCTAGKNVANWDYCMKLTFDPATNFKVACSLSKQGTYTKPWPHTAQKVCKVPVNL
jgi:cytochrome c553